MAQMVKRLPTMRETQVQSLGREDSLEEEMATHSSTLAWKIPWTEERYRLQSMGLKRVGCDGTFFFTFCFSLKPGQTNDTTQPQARDHVCEPETLDLQKQEEILGNVWILGNMTIVPQKSSGLGRVLGQSTRFWMIIPSIHWASSHMCFHSGFATN